MIVHNGRARHCGIHYDYSVVRTAHHVELSSSVEAVRVDCSMYDTNCFGRQFHGKLLLLLAAADGDITLGTRQSPSIFGCPFAFCCQRHTQAEHQLADPKGNLLSPLHAIGPSLWFSILLPSLWPLALAPHRGLLQQIGFQMSAPLRRVIACSGHAKIAGRGQRFRDWLWTLWVRVMAKWSSARDHWPVCRGHVLWCGKYTVQVRLLL